ncbi:NAD(P)-binding protein [Astrocystis sublimbata]|nr:NAD(P)-binding protein [Astrocystis sublimbata]
MGSQWSQFFPPNPHFTDVPSCEGKVFIVTGGSSGIGLELCKRLYQEKGRVYIAGRSEKSGRDAIQEIQRAVPGGQGSLEFLHLRLDDLESITASAAVFRSKESKLHVLWNNAGVSRPPVGSISKQGIELQLAVNCLGPFLFTQLLLPVLQSTASDEPGSVRVVWTSSQSVELSAPTGGFDLSDVISPPPDATKCYVNSKTGNIFLSTELARRYGKSSGIISVASNPGNALTNLFRHTPYVNYLVRPLLYKPETAAITQLYAGLSPDISLTENGSYIVPWGRLSTQLRSDLVEATKPRDDGGSGRAMEFWEFCVEKTATYM